MPIHFLIPEKFRTLHLVTAIILTDPCHGHHSRVSWFWWRGVPHDIFSMLWRWGGDDEYSWRKYLELLQIENYENRLNSSRPLQRTIQIRIEYNNVRKCRLLTEWSHIKPPIIIKTIPPTPHHYFLTLSAATILFLTICATAPLSLLIFHGVHLIILPAWWRRNSTGDRVIFTAPTVESYTLHSASTSVSGGKSVRFVWSFLMIGKPVGRPKGTRWSERVANSYNNRANLKDI